MMTSLPQRWQFAVTSTVPGILPTCRFSMKPGTCPRIQHSGRRSHLLVFAPDTDIEMLTTARAVSDKDEMDICEHILLGLDFRESHVLDTSMVWDAIVPEYPADGSE